MATSYPAGLDVFAPVNAADESVPGADGRDHVEHHDDINAAMVAVQTVLGISPAGGSATVAARILAVESDSRWTNSRTPTTHAGSHGSVGSDPVTVATSQVTGIAAYALLAGATFTGDVSVTKATASATVSATSSNATLTVNRAAGNYGFLNFNTANSARWSLFTQNAAEGGSNAGSDLALFRYNDAGGFLAGVLSISRATGATGWTGTTTITPVAAADIGLIIKGAAAQSANLQEWRNSSNTALALVSSNGYVVATGFQSNDSQGLAYSGNSNIAWLQTKSTGLLAQTSTAANVALTIKNAHATPTGNLTEWHSTAGAVLASVSAAGLGTFTGVTSTGLVATPATTTTTAGLRLPHGTAPTSPVNGDLWSTTAGMFARINGVTVGPFGSGGGYVLPTQTGNGGKFLSTDGVTDSWQSAPAGGAGSFASFAKFGRG